MPLDPEKIKKNMINDAVLRVFEVIGSTNDEAKRRAAEDAEDCVIYAARSQTAGRGRRGRSFFSPPTGLYMTLSLPAVGEPADIQRITCAAAVAVCEALSRLAPLSPSVKWVNDIYIGGRKAAGILAELVPDDKNRPLRVLIGIGVNLTTEDFPAELIDKAGSAGDIDPELLCAAVADGLIGMYRDPDNSKMMAKYKALNFCLGREVTYTDDDGSHTARAADIAPDGSLIVEENGIKKSLRSGEISVRLPMVKGAVANGD